MPNEITIKIKADTSELEAALERIELRLENLQRVHAARQAAYDMEDALDRVNDLLQDRRRLVSRLTDEAMALGEDQ